MIKRYDLPSDKGEGWAHIIIDTEIGMLSVVSDFGNYAYAWGGEKQTACEFREFLLRFDPKYPDYLCSKLLSDRPDRDVYDADGTKRRIRERIRGLEDKELRRKELAHFNQSEFEHEFDFFEWCHGTELGDASESASYKPRIHTVRFCKETIPRLQKILRAELAQERKQKSAGVVKK